MKKILLVPVLAIMCFMFSGCPYECAVPIDQPSIKISEKLLGSWHPDSSTEVYTITKLNDFTYHIEEKNGAMLNIYEGYASNVDGVVFLNIWGVAEKKRTYSIFKLEAEKDYSKIYLTGMNEKIKEKFTSSEQFKSYIQKNKSNPNFYDTDRIPLLKGE